MSEKYDKAYMSWNRVGKVKDAVNAMWSIVDPGKEPLHATKICVGDRQQASSEAARTPNLLLPSKRFSLLYTTFLLLK